MEANDREEQSYTVNVGVDQKRAEPLGTGVSTCIITTKMWEQIRREQNHWKRGSVPVSLQPSCEGRSEGIRTTGNGSKYLYHYNQVVGADQKGAEPLGMGISVCIITSWRPTLKLQLKFTLKN